MATAAGGLRRPEAAGGAGRLPCSPVKGHSVSAAPILPPYKGGQCQLRESWKADMRPSKGRAIRAAPLPPQMTGGGADHRRPRGHPTAQKKAVPPAASHGRPLFRRLRHLISCNKVAPLEVLEQPAVSDVLGIHIPSVVLLDKDQLYLLGIIQDCQAARLRGLRTLKYSKEETTKAILNILGHLEYFRDRPLSLALAFEALLQLSFMRPHFSPSMVSAILHRTTEAVLGSAEEDKEELKRPFQSLLGGLLLEAPNIGTLLQLLTDLRYYALLGSEDQRKLAASSISLLLALSQRFPNLRNTVIQSDLTCFRNNLKEDDIIIEEL
ncbi:Hypothetical predicted protein [Podarcis lilfordi]|uniref:Uncharacterized protein n=1 Tax=Podarcis lilfordi TaxID=74358 RepID=A0AA35K7M3_9SAUR|nr:Hypothetical predicted protein [Podarcis lilfordi]